MSTLSPLVQVVAWCWTGKVMEIHTHRCQEQFNMFVLHLHCHDCWWPGDDRSQGISSHGIDLFLLEYSSFNTIMVKFLCLWLTKCMQVLFFCDMYMFSSLFQFPSVFGNHNLRWEGVWRDLSCLTNATSFAVREQAGHSLKSSLKVDDI